MVDHANFLEFFLAHENALRVFVRTLVRDRSEFDDIFQTVVLTLWKKFDTYDPTRPFGPWSRGVAIKEIFQMRRESGRRPTPFSPETVQAILESFEREVTSRTEVSSELEALERCVEALPSKWKQLLDLRYSNGLRIAEMADKNGNTLASTQRELSRARQQLADCIKRRLTLIKTGTVKEGLV
jgi:RNA polymerase sigma-70 factor (ECF subfamily)